MERLAKVFRVLGNLDRLRLFLLLAQRGTGLCVCELVEALDLPQYQISKHLHELRRAGLIESVREGRWAYYSVSSEERSKRLANFLNQEIPITTIATELKRLRKSLSLRKDGRCILGLRTNKDNHG